MHFTGSVEAGRRVGAESGGRLHRAILELGGKDPVVIDAGVDPVATAAAVAFGAFVNSGQICTSMERIYVHRDIADEFIDALVERGLRLGDGTTPATSWGRWSTSGSGTSSSGTSPTRSSAARPSAPAASMPETARASSTRPPC